MRRLRTPLVLSLGFAALLLTGCSGHGWVVQRYPAGNQSNIAASDPFGAALLAPSRSQTTVSSADSP